MTIQYSMVARGQVVLAEFGTAATINSGSVARQILGRLPGNTDANVSYSQDRYIFHVKRTDGLTVLCMADDAFGRRIPFLFLEEIHQRFVRTYGRSIHTAPAYTMNEEFSRILNQEMDHYSNDANADRLNRLRGEMSQVRSVMIDNIDKVLQRGDRLTMLVEKTASMQGNTLRFRRQSQRYRNALWWKNFKLRAALVLGVLILIYIAFALICGGPFSAGLTSTQTHVSDLSSRANRRLSYKLQDIVRLVTKYTHTRETSNSSKPPNNGPPSPWQM